MCHIVRHILSDYVSLTWSCCCACFVGQMAQKLVPLDILNSAAFYHTIDPINAYVAMYTALAIGDGNYASAIC